MNEATVEILNPGPLALIQDQGRVGAQHLGIGVSGAADRHAAGWANRLLGNTGDAPLVEVCLGNFRLRFRHSTQFALTGADMLWTLNGRPVKNWSSHQAPAGAVLECVFATGGLRAYLALRGGITAPMICGSCATSMGDRLGGLHGDGQPLAAGDCLQVSQGDTYRFTQRYVPDQFQRAYGETVELRVVPSNQFVHFSTQSRRQFFATTFRVAPESDRMGVRMQGRALNDAPGNMTSEAVSPGAIQVPASGLPIVLMPDCQTIGGYPKLGHVYRVDLDWLAQARPGTRVRFVLGDRAESQQESLLHTQFFSAQECA